LAEVPRGGIVSDAMWHPRTCAPSGRSSAIEHAAAHARTGGPVEAPDLEDLEDTGVAVAPPWMTILHNCDCHTFEQVVKQLMKAIGCSEEKGWELAWQVHNTGKAVVKVGSEPECVKVGNILAAIGLVVTVAQS
jgi:ATP-dependent Clp protease adapter protein ClpS